MSFLNSVLNNSKKYDDPFKHWELNKPLTEEQINEIVQADIANPAKHNLNYDGTRAIAGKYKNAEGPERNHNVEPIYLHIILNEGKKFDFDVPSSHNSFLYLLKGELSVGEKKHDKTSNSNLILLEKGSKLNIISEKKSEFLFIAGKPIGEPIARGGPFVMNTKAEILEAIQDYNNGTFAKY